MKKPRYRALDALRGVSVTLMIIHHLALDFVMFGIFPGVLLDNPIVFVAQLIFSSCFVALSGASSRFSRSNLARGLKICVCAALISVSTYFAGVLFEMENVFISFGILHFLGIASLIYHLTHKLIDKLKVPGWAWLVMFCATRLFFPMTVGAKWLFPIGLMYPGFRSADYYPILPWIFMYFFGAWLADKIREGKLPKGFYDFKLPLFEWISKRSLIIYLLHQPLFLALFYLYFNFIA